MSGSTPIVAYRERESVDPTTGAPGILRDEWRIRPVDEFDSRELATILGPHWNYRGNASHVLEHRYIRRGVEESWGVVDVAPSFEATLEIIDASAIAVDFTLQEMQHAHVLLAEKRRLEAAAAEEREIEAEIRASHEEKSAAAFAKLGKGKDSVWADRWNTWVGAHESNEDREKVKQDAEFMRLYQEAMTTETVPTKRAAIKKFLAYAASQGLK